MIKKLGISGRIAEFFLDSRLTSLLAVLCLLMGLFAVVVTPREEEPQLSVTLVDVMIPFPGASVSDVEQVVVNPAEQVLARISGVQHIGSVARPGMAVITLQFKIGVPQTDALVRLYDTINSHSDWIPPRAGVLPPIIKPRDTDDVPAVTLALFSKKPEITLSDLQRVAHSIEIELKRVPGTRAVATIGGSHRAIMVEIDPARMRANGITVSDIDRALRSANVGLPAGYLLSGNRSVTLDAGGFFENAEDVADVMVGVYDGKPVLLREVAAVHDGPSVPGEYVWHGAIPGYLPGALDADKKAGAQEYPAVTLTVTKKTGENVVTVANALQQRIEQLRNTVIPPDIEVAITRNIGVAANDKAVLLMEKLLLVTASVVFLILIALGRREAATVLFVVLFTLSVTLFATWGIGVTFNRASLFALVLSIGMLVDDAVVVIENIHRHQLLSPGKPLREIIPGAVDEIGGPTILATFTVIAALMPLAFVPGMQGEYLRPIPVITSLCMFISLLIAITITPWLSMLWMKPVVASASQHSRPGIAARLAPLFTRFFAPLLHETRGRYYRWVLVLIVLVATVTALAMPFFRLVNFNMNPYDNKSDFVVVLDMPAGTPVEKTAGVLREMAAYIAAQPVVTSYQVYAGTAGPIGIPGLIRQYYLRTGGEYGDIQVNLVDKHHRDEKSHAIVVRLRPELVKIAQRHGGLLKVFDPPPGPPALALIQAEIYGPTPEGRHEVAKAVRAGFETTPGIVDISDSSITSAQKKVLLIDRSKAALLGVAQQDIVATLRTGLAGADVTYLHDASKYPAPVRLQLPASWHGDLETLLQLTVRSTDGSLVPVRELVTVTDAEREQPIMHKDLLPVHFVLADFDTSISSYILGMLKIRPNVTSITPPGGGKLAENFTRQPEDIYRGYTLKWDGEWQATYETFRDLGGAYVVGLILIYLLIVSQFSSYLTPLIIMAPIPFTIIGINYGHVLLRTDFTIASMIGLMALAGLLVRNSILLVDFINHRTEAGTPFKEAVVQSANVRAQPIILTSLAAMIAALFLLDDPIFNGLAVALIFGNLVSTGLTLVVIPTLYYAFYRKKFEKPGTVSV